LTIFINTTQLKIAAFYPYSVVKEQAHGPSIREIPAQLRIPAQIGTHSAGKSTLVPIQIGTCSDANRHPLCR